MRLSPSVITARIIALAALGVLGVFIFGVDPLTLTIPGHVLFFFSIWALITAFVFLCLVSLATRFLATRAAEAYLSGALRQGGLVGIFVVGLTLAQFFRYLTWWGALLSLALVLLIEFTARQFHRSPISQ
jgi:hypothetical protein